MEQIYTIPVNEAFDEGREKKECGCPICRLFLKLQENELDIILGASMMEPDIRIRTNELGFCLTHYNMMLGRRRMLGMGLILSALFVFFRDIQYLWGIFIQLLMYLSAIFYTVSSFPETVQKIFLLNPIYVYIKYFRLIVIDNSVPSIQYHLLALGYALIAFAIGALMYKKQNHKFLYYV